MADLDVRVSDREREAVADTLREHAAEGRLDPEELEERLTTAYAARTRGDLEGLTSDLPARAPAPPPRAPAAPSGAARAPSRRARRPRRRGPRSPSASCRSRSASRYSICSAS